MQKIDYTTQHKDSTSLFTEIQKVTSFLKRKGYFLLQKKVTQATKNEYFAFFSLGFQVTQVHIYIPEKIDHPKKNDTLKLKTVDVEPFLENLSAQQNKKGKSFSEISLKNLRLDNHILHASLFLKEENTRTISSILLKGYEELSPSIIEHDLQIKKGQLFTKEKLKDISKYTNSLQFIEEIKPPEVLFTKDSTIVYLYLKKKKQNSFDGIVSFASNEEKKGILFNGTVNLQLNNFINGGEHLSIFWNSIGNEKQEFSLKTRIPYVFNSRISPEISFNLYKQDSTFLNTEFNAKIAYKLTYESQILFSYSAASSNNLKENITNNNIESFDNSLYGIGYQYKGYPSNLLNNEGFHMYIEALYGKRKSPINNSQQTKINLELSNTFILNPRNQLYARNRTGALISDDFLENEIYRIGGANSIRGFNEQSIFASQFSYINLEYRYLTSKNSYLYSITDFGLIKTLDNSNESVIGLGLGYLFNIKNSQVNLGYALGKSTTSSFDFNQSKIIINFKSFF